MKAKNLAVLALMVMATPAFAGGDVDAGAKVFKKCASCHSPEAGKNKIGPSLHGIVGRHSASIEGFKYSKGMSEINVVWDEEHLASFLTNPKKYVKGTKMSFAGIKKEDDMSNLLAYLGTLK